MIPAITTPCAHQIFEKEAAANPTLTAVTYGSQSLTYRELNTRANQLARELQKRGVGLEVVVGIYLPSSLDSAIALLAIVKSGGISLVLPVSTPTERLRRLIYRGGADYVVTTSEVADRIDGFPKMLLCLDKIFLPLIAHPADNISSSINPENAASMRFTSGSTGEPKGVVNLHSSLTARALSSHPDVCRGDVCGLNAEQGLLRLLVPLVCGATVTIFDDNERRDITLFARAVERQRVTSIYAVPTLLRQLVDLKPELLSCLKTLRVIAVGGEAISSGLLSQVKRLLPQTELLIMYGGTEIGGAATMKLWDVSHDGQHNIGFPLENTNIYIVDSCMSPVPEGVKGELCVESSHMARGYAGAPDLTAGVFVPNPFAGRPGSRLYRTGDFGRILPTGEIEFLGRLDNQVKIRGYRVELAEVEAALMSLEVIDQAAVVPEAMPDGQRLVAYVVTRRGHALSIPSLRRALTSLPDYMLPTVFVKLDALPLTPTGKVDRRALPIPASVRPELDDPYEAPFDPLHVHIASIWASALKLDRIGLHDHFLHLGGDSVSGSQILSRLSSELNVEMTLLDLFAMSTLDGFTQEVRRRQQVPSANHITHT